SPAVAANKCQNDMLSYADAYAERLMLQKFVKAVKAQQDPEVKAVLKDVCDLFAVHAMRENGLWFVENGLMKPQTTTALRRLERELTEKIRPHAQMLTDAFGVPPAMLECKVPAATPPRNAAPPAPK
ncbi:MAG: acyl-CoA dehydrogenase, partial [Alphaproteobacteria bacterium]